MFNGFHLALPTPVCTPQAEASRRSQQNPRRVQNTGKTHDFQKTFLTGGLHVDELKKNIILSEHPVLSGRSKTLQGRMPRTFPIASFYLIGKAGATTLSSIPSRKQSTTGNHLLDVWPKLSIPQSAHKKNWRVLLSTEANKSNGVVGRRSCVFFPPHSLFRDPWKSGRTWTACASCDAWHCGGIGLRQVGFANMSKPFFKKKLVMRSQHIDFDDQVSFIFGKVGEGQTKEQ